MGISALKQNTTIQHCYFVDESAFACRSTQASIDENDIAASRTTVIQSHCLNNVHKKDIDCIVCNPPFHQQHSVDDGIAQQMIQQAYDMIKKDGRLFLVGNRHLSYHKSLNRLFSAVHTMAANHKFTLFEAIK